MLSTHTCPDCNKPQPHTELSSINKFRQCVVCGCEWRWLVRKGLTELEKAHAEALHINESTHR